MGQDFARSLAMFAAIRSALALPLAKREDALAAIGSYRSRGKGRGSVGRNFLRGANRSVYQPHQGKRECERRLRQAAA
jgi:hypothetical protein